MTERKQPVKQRLGPPVEQDTPIQVPKLQVLNNPGDPRLSPNGKISPINTTLIGDFVIKNMQTIDTKWTVQCLPHTNFELLRKRVESDYVDVMKRYIFLLIGGNIVFSPTVSRTTVQQQISMLLYAIYSRNPVAKIFFGGILPQLKFQHFGRKKVVAANRHLAAAIAKLSKYFPRIKYVPVQLQFHAGFDKVFFDQDGLALNDYGYMRVRTALLEGAGFLQQPVM